MDKDLLEKHQNDPAWAEVIRLYSGLFDTQDERESFILDLADKDILLAAECKTSSVEEEERVQKNITAKSESCANNFSNYEISAQGLLALLELNEMDRMLSLLVSISNLNITHKILIETIISQTDTSKALDILLALSNLSKTQKILFIWAIKSFDKEIIDNQIIKIKILLDKIIQNNFAPITVVENLIIKYKLKDRILLDKFVEKLIKNGKINHLKLVINWIEKYQDDLLIERLIQKIIKIGGKKIIKLAITWIEKYQLQNKFPELDIKKLGQTEQSISINDIMECNVFNIIPSRVFVKIKFKHQKASIYIGELTNQRLSNINDFEYNGEKLHLGQKLVAKVISIDEQGRINLSLKQVK